MNEQYSRIVEYFNNEVSHSINVDESSCSVDAWLRTNYGSFHMVVQSFGEEGNHVLFSVRDVMSVPEDKKPKALKLANLINWESIIGNFEIDEKDGELSCRIAYCLCASALTPEQFTHGFNLAMSMAVTYYPVFQKIFWADISPTEALNSLSSGERSEVDSSSSQETDIPEDYADEVMEQLMEVLKEDSADIEDRRNTRD